MIFKKKKKKNVFMYQEEIHLHQSIQKKGLVLLHIPQ